MMDIRVTFKSNENQGNFAIDAIAQTLGGNWSERKCNNSYGVVTDVNPNERQWAEEMLRDNDKVESFSLSD